MWNSYQKNEIWTKEDLVVHVLIFFFSFFFKEVLYIMGG